MNQCNLYYKYVYEISRKYSVAGTQKCRCCKFEYNVKPANRGQLSQCLKVRASCAKSNFVVRSLHLAIRTLMDSFTNDHLSCLAVVQDSSVHFWFLPQDKFTCANFLSTNTSSSNSSSSSSSSSDSEEISDPNLSTYKPQPISTSPIKSIQWNPRSFKLAVIDESGECVYLQQLLFGKNHDYESTTSEILTLSLQSENCTATCIGFPRSSGRYLAVGINTGWVNVYNCGNKQITLRCQLRCTNLHPFNVSSNGFQPKCISWVLNDRIIAAGYNNGSIVLFLAASDKITPSNKCENYVLPFPCQYSKSNNRRSTSPLPPECCILKTSKFNSNLLCCGYSNGSIILWNIQWPAVGDTNQYILNYWNVKSFTKSVSQLSLIENYKRCISIAFSSNNDQLLYSAGLPDFNLRVWDILSTSCQKQQQPVKCLSPEDELHGYLSVDVASRTHILATGLLNGEVWLYNVQDISAPIHCISTGSSDTSIRLLSFSSTLRGDVNEIDFSTTSSSQLTNENSYSKSINSTHLTCNSLIRQPLSELTNIRTTAATTTTETTEQVESQTTWAAMLHEFYQSESKSQITNISSSNRSLFDESPLRGGGSGDTSEALTLDSINEQSTSALKSLTSHHEYDSLLKDNKSSIPPVPIDGTSSHHTTATTTTTTVDTEKLQDTLPTTTAASHIPIEALDKYLSVRLGSMMSELNWSHNELLYKFAQLECKLDQMNQLLLQMKQENDVLRVALTKRRPF
ncbi:unnamed protein product [Trichobilharzia szidati]|nr:unnamed protein product [Trichobilharzia szidati]